jgi:DNA-directed RNA polymerase subunit N (RpoN/RPB10)
MMSTIENRLSKLESRVPLRCFKCGHPLHCDVCEFGRDVRECSDEELIDIITAGMKRLGRDPSFFNSLGYDLNELSVEELRQLRGLLGKAAGESPEAEAQ